MPCVRETLRRICDAILSVFVCGYHRSRPSSSASSSDEGALIASVPEASSSARLSPPPAWQRRHHALELELELPEVAAAPLLLWDEPAPLLQRSPTEAEQRPKPQRKPMPRLRRVLKRR
ncbi:uncharacterized protein LOC126354763 [Schistocerca gregaria]|uniref:uncharacterized protein LOC126354763 n=1 Tax=Schistocerca gregaria TaxID=7010 RepID=UPI00211E9D7F|nr:uncharacterized protein LOC126354763 [Schistocerca gregaria]